MHHNVDDFVLNAFSRLRAGRSSITVGGLRAIPLISPLPAAPRALRRASSVLSWAELDPPHPAWLRAGNVTFATVTVPAGAVIAGGMSARTLRIATVVEPRGWTDVSVEPLGARWWDEGKPWRAGRLGPVATALLLQALLGEADVASSARTALWSLSPRDAMASQNTQTLGRAIAGWLLCDEAGALAGWLTDSGTAAPTSVWGAETQYQLAEILESLRSGIDAQMLVPHVLDTIQWPVELAIIPEGHQLIDRIIAAVNAHTG